MNQVKRLFRCNCGERWNEIIKLITDIVGWGDIVLLCTSYRGDIYYIPYHLCLSPSTFTLFSNTLYLFTLFSNTRYPHWATRKVEFMCSDAPNSVWHVINVEERWNTIDLHLRISLVLRSAARNWTKTNKSTRTARLLATFCKYIKGFRRSWTNRFWRQPI